MKTKNLIFMLLVALSTVFVGCTNNPYQGQSTGLVTINESEPSVGENLDLQALGELVKQSNTPQEIEQKLNMDNSINNLDLDGDGNRDYLKVTEFGEGNDRGYSITDVQSDGEPEVATINVNIQDQTMQLNGNPNYYGNMNNSYQSSFTTTDFLLLSWMMQPHYTYYRSPYHYGYYGYNYRPVPVVSYRSYHSSPYISNTHSKTKTTYKTTTKTTTTTHMKSPNSNNTSKAVSNHVSVSKPTHSQKSFEKRDNSKPIKSGGFNSKPSSSSSLKSSYKPKSSSSSSSSSSSKSSSYKPKSSSSSSYKKSSSSSWGKSSSSSRSSSSRSSSSSKRH
jgi:hypothetical protein